ncbi:MAG TPA: hypothetical protein VGX71_23160 [Pseudaminobacter sp.]|nr:hypothetical protein [Pseudaminobacter sp.]
MITDKEISAAIAALRRHGFAIGKDPIRDALEAASKARQSRDDAPDAPTADDEGHVDGRASARADDSSCDRSSPTSRNSAQGSMPICDDQDIERLATRVRYLNAQYDRVMAKRRLQAAHRPAWLPPAEFIGMAVLGIGATAAIFILLTLLSGLD